MSDNFIELCNRIRENITPRGDGNSKLALILFIGTSVHKREYNSERRRKLIYHQYCQ